jgi:protein involved in polysaccharide export with SLBB domain
MNVFLLGNKSRLAPLALSVAFSAMVALPCLAQTGLNDSATDPFNSSRTQSSDTGQLQNNDAGQLQNSDSGQLQSNDTEQLQNNDDGQLQNGSTGRIQNGNTGQFLSGANTSDTAMPAAQLIEVLRGSPEVMVEVKSVVADSAQQQGITVQADSLTDEQVYTQIENSKKLRITLTHFLLARGYITEEQIQTAREQQEEAFQRNPMEQGDREDVQAPASRTSASRANSNRAVDQQDSGRPLGERQTQSRTYSGDRAETHGSEVPNLTDEPAALHRQAPYNLLSLRDLYTQVPDSQEHLKRFGSNLFVTHAAPGRDALEPDRVAAIGALDVPLGPDYVLGPGDELSVALWGGISQNILRTIDREGRVALPEAGLVPLAGLSVAKAETLLAGALQSQYRNLHLAITVAHLRSIRIFVVGDVQRPGSYEVSSLASPITALFAAGGPTAVGSLRTLRHYRNEKLIGEIDMYDFMLHGVRPNDDRMQGGDTLLIPPVGPQVAVSGAVKRPAIYELRSEKDLASVLEDAGGFTVAAALAHVTIERMIANQHREEITVEAGIDEAPTAIVARLQSTEVKDGDRIHIATVLPSSGRVVYLQGHVARPGKIAYRDDMHLEDVLHSYRELLPEPADHGEIVRLVAPDLHPETIAFNVPDVLIGNVSIALQPFDTIRIFGRYELDAPKVSVRGEVLRPGTYPMFEGMTAAQLIRTAGGFKRDAMVERADLASYQVINGSGVSVERRDVSIADAVLKHDRDADVILKAGDVLTVHQLTGWTEIGESILIQGEVAHPGSYGFREGERLSDVLRRAGGLRPTAYPEGAVLTRPDVARLEKKSREELIRQIETSSAASHLSPSVAGSDQAASLQLIQQQQDQILARLRSQPASGRLVIHIAPAIESWAGTAADIEVRSGDILRIPKRPGFILVTGQVYNASAITFMPGKTAEWYLQKAGGASETANRKEIFVIRANGSVVGRRSSNWYEHNVLSTKLDAGDTIVVPQKIVGASAVWRDLLSAAQVAASLAIAAAVAGL